MSPPASPSGADAPTVITAEQYLAALGAMYLAKRLQRQHDQVELTLGDVLGLPSTSAGRGNEVITDRIWELPDSTPEAVLATILESADIVAQVPPMPLSGDPAA